ncbi:hypothetical protein D5S18_06010 [Nocardia panacis]|uniref:Uncharacterized protein n=1 Tax=Nocardia panacis TaxID=2340916 RepID=A0A3A4KMS8_9NOCA|nr:hypothetical protein [Nocardia panacis]RJO78437.1 hypothetical protein D5S18_06010 [Nocardia panacis]
MTSELYIGSAGDRARAWSYQRDFWPGMIGYLVVLAAVGFWGNLDGHSPWRYLWAVLPALPALWIVRAVWRHIGRIDDYQRLLLLRGLAGGFAAAMITAMVVGLLDIAGLFATLPIGGWIIFGAGMTGWVVAGQIRWRR